MFFHLKKPLPPTLYVLSLIRVAFSEENEFQFIVPFLDFPVSFFDKKITSSIDNANYRKKASVNKSDILKSEAEDLLPNKVFGTKLKFRTNNGAGNAARRAADNHD